jgi:threonine dehydratase
VTAPDLLAGPWPINLADVQAARERLRPYLVPTPLRSYPALDKAAGGRAHVLVKHENHNPTNSFKVRNALSALTALGEEERRRGVVAATRGNYGQGLAYAGRVLGVSVTLCVPRGNVVEKNNAMREYGAQLVVTGNDYDDAVEAAERLARQRGLVVVHSTNNRFVLAGAGTISLEAIEQDGSFDTVVVAVGGGSQAVGALTVLRGLGRKAEVYGVQAEGAPAVYESWRAGRPVAVAEARTFADGIATRNSYEMTLPALCEGLAGFITVSDAEIAEALRLLITTTHNLAEGAGAAGLAGLLKLGDKLDGRRCIVILSGGNIDFATLRRVLNREL